MLIRRLAIGVALALVVGGAEAKPRARKPAVVALTFAWPDGLKCSVESKTKIMTAKARSADDAMEHFERLELAVTRTEAGWRVQRTLLDADPAVKRNGLVFPSFAVAPDGALGALDYTPEQRATLAAEQKKRDERNAQLKKDMPALAMTIPPVEEQVLGQTQRFWRRIVGNWAGQEVAVGTSPPMPQSNEFAVGDLGSVRNTGDVTLTVTPRVPCAPSGPATCVRLVIASAPRMSPVAGGKMTAEETSMLGSMRSRDVTTIVTDPATLVPSSVTRVMATTAPAMGPGSVHVEETETYHCAR